MPIPPSSANSQPCARLAATVKAKHATSEGHGASERDRTADALPMRVLQ